MQAGGRAARARSAGARARHREILRRAHARRWSTRARAASCAVWLIDDERQRCDPWMAYVESIGSTRARVLTEQDLSARGSGRTSLRAQARVDADDRDTSPTMRGLPEAMCGRSYSQKSCSRRDHRHAACPRQLHARLAHALEPAHRRMLDGDWWRVVLDRSDCPPGSAGAASEPARPSSAGSEERRKAILEERNRLARDIHDNLAQGFAAILMQLQARAARSAAAAARSRARASRPRSISARTHHDRGAAVGRRAASERRRRRGHRDRRSSGSPISRSATTDVPIDVSVDELPRFGDGVEREIIGIAQEALTNARAPLARAAHHDPRVDGAIDRPAAVGRRRRPRHSRASGRRRASA